MAIVPWVLEVEMVTFGLAPLLLPPRIVADVVLAASGFYVLAAGVNLHRAWRIAARPSPARPAPDPQAPDVDVVIATRNRPELLARAIAAVREQDYPGQVTVHVVFDGTVPDPALERIGGRRRVRVLSNDRTPGLAGARNCGILAGCADLVAFCDDDDTWRPEKLRRQVRALQDAGADTAVSGIEVQYRNHTVVRIPRPGDLTLASLVRRRVMEAHPSTVLVRRTALTGPIGLVDEDIPGSYGEDFDWIIRAARHGAIAVAPEPLVRVLWGQSLFSRNWQTIVDAIDYGLRKTPEFSADPLALGRLYGRRAFALAALGRRDALPAVVRTLRVSPREKRAYLAAAVALHLVSADRLLDLAHRRGHGI
jgi:glycosyltransferase involved in cell wall biosynthesis